MPPFAGQGMNGGIKDAANLAWKLSAVLKGLAAETILDSYEPERAPVVRKMVEVSRRLGAVIMPTSRGAAALRDAIFGCLNMSRAFRDFIGGGGGAAANDRRSALTGAGRDAVIGQMLPQPSVKTPNGTLRSIRFRRAISGWCSASASIRRRSLRGTSASSMRSTPFRLRQRPQRSRGRSNCSVKIRFRYLGEAPRGARGAHYAPTVSSPIGSICMDAICRFSHPRAGARCHAPPIAA
jgi:hypothetical protein